MFRHIVKMVGERNVWVGVYCIVKIEELEIIHDRLDSFSECSGYQCTEYRFISSHTDISETFQVVLFQFWKHVKVITENDCVIVKVSQLIKFRFDRVNSLTVHGPRSFLRSYQLSCFKWKVPTLIHFSSVPMKFPIIFFTLSTPPRKSPSKMVLTATTSLFAVFIDSVKL